MQNAMDYISRLITDGKSLYFHRNYTISGATATNTMIYQYEAKKHTINPYLSFDGDPGSLDRTKMTTNGYMSWLGKGKQDGKGLDWYLYDMDKKIPYAFDDFQLFVSDYGVTWGAYETPWSEVEKGGLFKNQHSSVRFKKLD